MKITIKISHLNYKIILEIKIFIDLIKNYSNHNLTNWISNKMKNIWIKLSKNKRKLKEIKHSICKD